MDRLKDGYILRSKDRLKNGYILGSMDRLKNGQIKGWKDGRMDKWMNVPYQMKNMVNI